MIDEREMWLCRCVCLLLQCLVQSRPLHMPFAEWMCMLLLQCADEGVVCCDGVELGEEAHERGRVVGGRERGAGCKCG